MAPVRLFLCGDVMIGRGIDQVLEHPCDPGIHEGWLQSALDYVRIAEEAHGPIPRACKPGYVWGEALEEIERAAPDARIVNLETAATLSNDWEAKGINYRASPANAAALLGAARIDCCTLANNHVLDWGPEGLADTLQTLRVAGVQAAGAGRTLEEAEAPGVVALRGGGRVLVFACAFGTSGVPSSWAAGRHRAGVALLRDPGPAAVAAIAERIRLARRPGDLVVVSVHWGPNWGYEVSAAEQAFASELVAHAGADLFHGHSSHHAKAIEVHAGKLILYGCGDLINDYEGIGGHEAFRGDLGVLYFPRLEAGSGRLASLEMALVRMRRFSARRAPPEDARWLAATLSRESRRFGASFTARPDGRVELVV